MLFFLKQRNQLQIYNVIIHFEMSSIRFVEEDNNEVCVLHVEEKVNTK